MIKQPLVAGHSVRPQGQPTKDVQPVLHRHEYDVPVPIMDIPDDIDEEEDDDDIDEEDDEDDELIPDDS